MALTCQTCSALHAPPVIHVPVSARHGNGKHLRMQTMSYANASKNSVIYENHLHISMSLQHSKPAIITNWNRVENKVHVLRVENADDNIRDALHDAIEMHKLPLTCGTAMLLCALMLPSVAAAATIMTGFASSDHHVGSFLVLSDLDPSVAALLVRILGPILASLNFLFILRIVMSWYPQLPVNKFPYVIAYVPTEPVLDPTRKLIPPVGGVDVSPVIWVALMSFLNEILLGQQGLLVLLSQQQS